MGKKRGDGGEGRWIEGGSSERKPWERVGKDGIFEGEWGWIESSKRDEQLT